MPERSNCAVYAVTKFLREGGYIVVGRSDHGWWPHVRHTFDFVTFSYFAMRPKDLARWKRGRHWCPPRWFKGRSRAGRLSSPNTDRQ